MTIQDQSRPRRILEPAGYDVIAVPLAPIALGTFHKTKPGLVAFDVCRPGKSSQDLCRRIRVNSESVPLLVFSDGSGVAEVPSLEEYAKLA